MSRVVRFIGVDECGDDHSIVYIACDAVESVYENQERTVIKARSGSEYWAELGDLMTITRDIWPDLADRDEYEKRCVVYDLDDYQALGALLEGKAVQALDWDFYVRMDVDRAIQTHSIESPSVESPSLPPHAYTVGELFSFANDLKHWRVFEP